MNPAAKSILLFGLVGLILAGSVVAVFQVTPIFAKEGKIEVYFANVPSDILSDPSTAEFATPDAAQAPGRPALGQITSLNITIDSVQVHKSGEADEGGWTEILEDTMTIDLMKPTDVAQLVATASIPMQNITMVRLHVAQAVAAVSLGTGTVSIKDVKVPSDKLEIPLRPDAQVKGQLTTSIIVQRPHVVVAGNGQVIQIILTPGLHVGTKGPE